MVGNPDGAIPVIHGAVVKGVLRTALMSLTADSAVVFMEVVATTGGMGGTGRAPPEAIPPPTGFGVIEVGPELVALGLGYLALPLLYWAPCKPWKVIVSRGLMPPGIPTLA